jgi:hypothetical protein
MVFLAGGDIKRQTFRPRVSSILRVGHRVFADKEFGHENAMLWQFIQLGEVVHCWIAPHQEFAGGYANELDGNVRVY